MKSFSFYSTTGIILSMLLSSSVVFSQNSAFNPDRKVEMIVETSPSKAGESLQILQDGNKRFLSGVSTHERQDQERVKDLTKGQNPKCIIVSCSDSRVPPEIVFDQGLGDIFSIRTAGNVMSDYEEGSIEYAVEHLHTPLVVVMGHLGCGAIQALLDHADDLDGDLEKSADHVSKIIHKLKSEEEEQEVLKTAGKNSNLAVVANVMNGVKQLRKSDPVLKEAYDKGEVNIVGAVYHIESGEVEFLDI